MLAKVGFLEKMRIIVVRFVHMNTKAIDIPILNIFGQLLNQTHDVFVVFDSNWNFVFANRKACDYFGDGQELKGKNLMEQFPIYRNSRLIDQMLKARTIGKGTEFEELSPYSKRWMHYRLYPLDGWLAVYASDIHLRKEAQRTIQQNQERYFNFIAQSSEGIWRYELEEPIPTSLSADEQIDMVYQHAYLAECNDAMAKMYGFRDAYDLVGSRLEMLLPRNEENLAYLHAFIQSGYRLSDAESKEVAKDGSAKYMLNNLIGIIENGAVVRAWGTQRDITAIKEVEEKLKETQEQLSFALMAGDAGTFIWNIQTNEAQWTKEQEALYGLPEGAFAGNQEIWYKAVHPEDLPAAEQQLWHAINNRKPMDMEFRIIWPDGSIHWILAKGKISYTEDGRPERLIGFNIDITKWKNRQLIV